MKATKTRLRIGTVPDTNTDALFEAHLALQAAHARFLRSNRVRVSDFTRRWPWLPKQGPRAEVLEVRKLYRETNARVRSARKALSRAIDDYRAAVVSIA